MNELAIGVDIGGTRTKSGLVNLTTGDVLHQIVQPTVTGDEQAFIKQVGDAIHEFSAVATANGSLLKGIGIGVPGFTLEDGRVETTYGFLEFMEDYPLKTIVEREFSLPCFIDNDARTVSLGEALYGKGKNYKRVLTLTLGTGVGFGLVINGRFTEPLPLAHMGGHITITDINQRCYCGKTGCLEDLVSAAGIERLIKKLPGSMSGLLLPELFSAAANNNEEALKIIDTITGYLHTAIYNYSNLFAPDIIVLGGGIAKGLKPFLAKIKGETYLSSYPGYSFDLEVSELEERAGILGSAALLRLFINTKKINQ